MNRNDVVHKITLYATLLCFFIISSSIALSQSDPVLKNATDIEKFSVSAEASKLSLSGTVFHDLNQDSFMQDGETGLGNWKISLIDSRRGANPLNTTSDEKGRYSFNDLLPGDYTVVEELVAGWKQTAPGAGKYVVTLADKDAMNLNFGNTGGNVSAPARKELGVMRFTPEQIRAFQDRYNKSPNAAIIPEITKMLVAPTATSFSLLPYLSYVTSERQQGYCGNCWVWGGTGVMEIDRAVRKGTKERLSVQWFNSNYNGGSGSSWACCGGWQYEYAGFYSESPWAKAIPWSNANAQFLDGGRECSDGSTSVLASSISTSPFYGIYSNIQQTVPTTGISSSQAISNIKNVLNQKKAIVFSFFIPNSEAGDDFQQNFWNSKTESAVYNIDKFCGQTYDSESGWGHATLLVGYDDVTRTWLVLNSWGTAGGKRPNGLFRISMDMNYNCQYPGLDGVSGTQAFYFETHAIVSAGDGVGVFRPSNKVHYLDFNMDGVIEKSVVFGLSGDVPISICRIWSTKTNGIGVYRPSTKKFYLDYDLNGVADKTVTFGLTGDIPIAGSWGTDWEDGVGVYRPSTKKFYLDYDLNGVVDKIVTFGLTGDKPISGDWDGDGYDGVGVYRPSTKKFYLDNDRNGVADKTVTFGLTGDKPISGDWNGDRKDGVGVYRPSTHKFYLDNNLDGVADKIVTYGIAGDAAVISSKG